MAEVNESVEFLPGFTNFAGTKPGAVLKKEEYLLTFSEVLLNGKKSAIVSRGFESCYDWTDVMNILIDSLEEFENIQRAEEFATEDLYHWLMSYSGWGLLSCLLPRKQHVRLNRKLREIKENWPQHQEYSEEGCWCILFQDSDLEDIIPDFEVTISDGELRGDFGRKKWFDVRFISTWNMTVRFGIEKKKCENNLLVNIAAAAVAKQLEDVDHVEDLEIPKTLRSPVTKRWRDFQWVSSSEMPENVFSRE